MKYTTYNAEKGYYEIVKGKSGRHNFFYYGMKLEDGEIVIPMNFYAKKEIRLAIWELCCKEKKYKIVGQVVGLRNLTIVKERD